MPRPLDPGTMVRGCGWKCAGCGVVAVRKEKLEQGACTGINLSLEVGGSAPLPPAAVVTRRIHASHTLMSTGPVI